MKSPGALRGFTLIELMVVLVIIAVGTAGASLAFRDSGDTLLQREAERLTALLESARAQSRASGVPVRWHATPQGFVFEGLPQDALPRQWLDADTHVQPPAQLTLGPEPMIGVQAVELVRSASGHSQRLRVATDGLRPFRIEVPGAENAEGP